MELEITEKERPDVNWDPDDISSNIFYLNEYSINLIWGGLEEGGWWYPQGEFIRCRAVTHEYDSALKLCYKFNADIMENENEGKYPLESILSRNWHTITIEKSPGMDYPIVTPHYE